jgi:hypothetical protein
MIFKRKMKTTILTLAIVMLLVSSCKKNDIELIAPEQPVEIELDCYACEVEKYHKSLIGVQWLKLYATYKDTIRTSLPVSLDTVWYENPFNHNQPGYVWKYVRECKLIECE